MRQALTFEWTSASDTSKVPDDLHRAQLIEHAVSEASRAIEDGFVAGKLSLHCGDTHYKGWWELSSIPTRE